jgi:hypothetical protein
MFDVKELTSLFSDNINNNIINRYGVKRIRYKKNGIEPWKAVLYRFLYTQKDKTKQEIASRINLWDGTNFTRQGYESKESSINIKYYEAYYTNVIDFYNKISGSNGSSVLAVDGVNNSNNERKVMTNLGLFDINNGVPINISYYGPNYRNNEVNMFINEIKSNPSKYTDVIFVCDRLYYNFDLLDFLIKNGCKYVIRAKGTGDNVDPTKEIKKGTPKQNLLNSIRKVNRIVRCKGTIKKTVCKMKKKIPNGLATIDLKNDCVLITNLEDIDGYTDQKILDLYRTRWDIEVFFKFVKYNFKFQYLNEKDETNYKKAYVCELILVYLCKIIEVYCKQHNVNKINEISSNTKINKSNLMKGIYDTLLIDLLKGTLKQSTFDSFCKCYITLTNNEKNRSFPRNSKTPFTKWYIKGYSDITKFAKVLKAIQNGTVDKLNKNLKTIANKVIGVT